MEIVRDIISKGSPLAQLQHESPHYQSLKESPYWTQLWVLRTVPADEVLAMKTDLSLTWSKLRVLRRCVKVMCG